jgi:hypothetical protein
MHVLDDFHSLGSNKSLDSASVGLWTASDLILALQTFISSSVTGSSPYQSLNVVNFFALEMDVLWLHTALCISSAHLPFAWSSRIFLIAENISVFSLSTALFD